MKTRKFLVPLTALIATFTSQQSSANFSHQNTAPIKNDNEQIEKATVSDRVITSDGKNKFSFVLKRLEGGMLMADHESHYSHSSHSSHRSHYSGY
jgi:hypothetical protein